MIENWRKRLYTENTCTSQLLKQAESIFSKHQPGQGFNLHYEAPYLLSEPLNNLVPWFFLSFHTRYSAFMEYRYEKLSFQFKAVIFFSEMKVNEKPRKYN